MHITTVATVLAQGEHHVVNELPAPTWVFGVGMFLFLLLCLLVTLSMRSVGLRHQEHGDEVQMRHGAGPGRHEGLGDPHGR